jgi:hypothetical protein
LPFLKARLGSEEIVIERDGNKKPSHRCKGFYYNLSLTAYNLLHFLKLRILYMIPGISSTLRATRVSALCPISW